MKTSLFGRTFGIVAGVVIAVTAIVLAVGLAATEKLYIESNAAALERAALSAAAFLPPEALQKGDPQEAAAFCTRLAEAAGFRVTLIDSTGQVLADSGAEASAMANHGDRPEISAALAGKESWSRRRSDTLGEWMLYAAVPLYGPDAGPSAGLPADAVLRLALPLPGLMDDLAGVRWSLAAAALAAACAALVASGAFTRLLSRPLSRLSERAGRYLSGDLEPRKFPEDGPADIPREFLILSDALDSMAAGLMQKASEAEALGKRYSAILDSAGEAIIALDTSLRIVEANPAAHELFEAAPGSLPGQTLAEAAGSTALSSMAAGCLSTLRAEKKEISLYSKSERTLLVNVSPLGDDGSEGLVLTATDTSALRRLETVRRDFIANLSHELRTPIQLIRGFAETLRAGEETPEQAQHYIEIIEKNAIRMERIIADLLSLARLERDSSGWMTVGPCSLKAIADTVLESMAPQAAARSIGLEFRYPEDLKFTANSGLVEQALINLVENAVRYSPPESIVMIEGRVSGDSLELSVRDRGSGIPAPDLERIFERFYRADKSRDRKSGGTGLGLAIVRHIALAHGGTVQAESWAGEGSVFTLRLPLAGPPAATVEPASGDILS
ncbi:MAG: ATP-binding protein [Rectinemataceae bacterium]